MRWRCKRNELAAWSRDTATLGIQLFVLGPKPVQDFCAYGRLAGDITETSDGTSDMDRGSAISETGVQLGEADAVKEGEEERGNVRLNPCSRNTRFHARHLRYLQAVNRPRLIVGEDKLQTCWPATKPPRFGGGIEGGQESDLVQLNWKFGRRAVELDGGTCFLRLISTLRE
ncbi:hypothetical protein EV363DRAFT_1344559 [Boletus edulis]|nr:hypothetical protein EV363DRAFT_1344559 [Boletus edulis]